MKAPFVNHVPAWGTILCLLFPLQRGAAQYAQVTAEIEVAGWGTRGLEVTPYKLRCVVGTNCWQMDGGFARNGKVTYWFTGTNLIERTVLTEGTVSVPAGTQWTRKLESADGNPGRPIRESDFLTMPGRIAWLAFCSAPCLKRQGHRLFPPDDWWKELIDAPSGFSDNAVLFKDTLGLPNTVNLYTTNDQPVFQYRVAASTNVLGWELPLEFYLAEYRPAAATHGWELNFTAKGRVTTIGVGTEPEIPPEVEKAVEK